jgi:hypothetical protein
MSIVAHPQSLFGAAPGAAQEAACKQDAAIAGIVTTRSHRTGEGRSRGVEAAFTNFSNFSVTIRSFANF